MNISGIEIGDGAPLVTAVVGASTIGKTHHAFRLAKHVGARTIVCGDQYQVIAGFPLATGSSDAYRLAKRHPSITLALFGVLPGSTETPMSGAEYADRLAGIIRHSDAPVVIDGLSAAYVPFVRHLVHRMIGLPSTRYTSLRGAWRGVRGLMAGVISEVANGVARYGDSAWIVRNSVVIRHVRRYTDGETGIIPALWDLWRLDHAVVAEKDRALLACGGIEWRLA